MRARRMRCDNRSGEPDTLGRRDGLMELIKSPLSSSELDMAGAASTVSVARGDAMERGDTEISLSRLPCNDEPNGLLFKHKTGYFHAIIMIGLFSKQCNVIETKQNKSSSGHRIKENASSSVSVSVSVLALSPLPLS